MAVISEPAIRMIGVGKCYTKREDRTTLVRSLIPFNRPRRTEMWALRDVNLAIQPGEVVGVIGANGAGKTTMLRLLAGVSRPSEGSVEVRGRIAPLLSLGIGFQREMSGRDNVYLNGMLLGLSRAEVSDRFDSIVAFAELADFIDVPVKFYSSGMYVRLGFAIAVHTDPRVLLVDEVLSVGDFAFRAKCLRRLSEIRANGATVVMVSHELAAIQQLCARTVVVRGGRIEFDGATEEALATLHRALADGGGGGGAEAIDPHAPALTGGARVLDRTLLRDGEEVRTASVDDELVYRVRVGFDQGVASPGFQFRVVEPDGQMIYAQSTPLGLGYRNYEAGDEVVLEQSFKVRLGPGTHKLQLLVYSNDVRRFLLFDTGGLSFFVEPQADRAGKVDLAGTITVDGVSLGNSERYLDGEARPG